MTMHQTSTLAPIDRSALLLIEFQNAWLAPDGGLHSLLEPTLPDVAKRAQRLLERARHAGLRVVHAPLRYSPGYPELRTDAHLGLAAAIPKFDAWTAYGQDFAPAFVPQPGEFVVSGRTSSSAFAGSNLDTYLRANDIRTLYLMGFALHVCVESTLRAAHDLGFETIVVSDASGVFEAHQRDYLIENVIHHFGASIDTAAFLAILEDSLPHEVTQAPGATVAASV